MAVIQADSQAFNTVANALQTASDEYRTNLARLTSLIEQITRGDFRGTAAETFKQKFESKQDTFNNLKKTLDEIEHYMEDQNTKFNTTVSNVQDYMG